MCERGVRHVRGWLLKGGGVVNIIYIIFHVEFLDVRDKSNSQTNDGLHLL